MTANQRLQIAINNYPTGIEIQSLSGNGAGTSKRETIKYDSKIKIYPEYSDSISTTDLRGFIYDGYKDEWAKCYNGGNLNYPPNLMSDLETPQRGYDEKADDERDSDFRIGDIIPGDILNKWCPETEGTYSRMHIRGKWGAITSNTNTKWSDSRIDDIQTIDGKLAGRLTHAVWIELTGLKRFMKSGKFPSQPSIFSSSNTNQNGKASRVKEGTIVKVQRFVISVTRGQRPRGTEVQGRRRKVAIAVGHLSHRKVSV
jgi:hypothetical protein